VVRQWARSLLLGFPRLHPARQVFVGYLGYILLGWILLCLPFAQKGGAASALDNLFTATSAVSTTGLVTLSVSAFCTAGFSLSNSSLEPFVADFWVNAVIAALSYLGAIGFIVCVDFWRMLRGKVKRMTLTSRIILWTTLWLSFLGTLLLFVGEPSLRALPPDRRLLAAFFQCMTAMTTVGFNTINIAALSKASLLLIIVLMVIGASPAGTGGGIKSTTLSAMVGVMRSAARGEREVSFWGRTIPIERVHMASATLGYYLFTLTAGTYLLEIAESTPFEANFFEAASALGTVGLSMGITPELTNLGRLILILLMFCGRVGPLTLGAALFCRPREGPVTRDGDLAI
jgi:trk system potassium uptake protein TrkH